MKSITFTIVKKELKEMFRDRTCIILFLLPVLIFPVLNLGISYISSGAAANSSDIKIAFINENDNTILNDYIYRDCPYNMEIHKGNSPFNSLENNDIDLIIKSSADNKIAFIYNSSNCSSLLTATKIGEDFEKYAITTEKSSYPEIINCSLENEKGKTADISSTVSTIISPILFILLLSQGSTLFANDLFAGEKERKTIEILFLSGASRTKIYFGKIAALFTIEMLNGVLCTISYILSGSITNSEAITQNIFKSDNMIINSICLIMSSLSIIIFSVIISAFISIISKSIKSAQKANEIFSALPALLTGIIMFGSFSVNKTVFSFIPVINIIKAFINAVYSKASISDTVTAFLINGILCSLIMFVSIKHIKSEKILQK